MTKFEELQAAHERLLEQSKAPEDVTVFVDEVQREIQNMCVAAEDVPAPRERDQLRAILRFWASYVYDHTGTYPDTTPRPAKHAESSTATRKESSVPPLPPRRTSSVVVWGIAVVAIVIAAAALGALSQAPGKSPTEAEFVPVSTPNDTVIVVATAEPPTAPALEIQSSILTSGPSPFDPTVWATRLQLSAMGGNGMYIFWANGVRLPDGSDNQFTVEGTGCESKKPVVGVTSGGQATSLEIIIPSPLPSCPQP
jgi:hypothetical protein